MKLRESMIKQTEGEDKLPQDIQEMLNDELAVSLVNELSEKDVQFNFDRLTFGGRKIDKK